MTCRRVVSAALTIVATFFLAVTPVFALQPPPGQSEFVPIDQLPPTEQMPAAPLLITAYAFFLVLMVVYVWSVWRRLNRVQTEMRALEQKLSRTSR